MTNAILPCPHPKCGEYLPEIGDIDIAGDNGVHTEHQKTSDGDLYQLWCGQCLMMGPKAATEADAIKAWNEISR